MLPLGDYSLHITPVAATATIKNNDEKYTYIAGHFDGQCDAPVLYCPHCPLEEVHGFL
jgi:hypothetical protein